MNLTDPAHRTAADRHTAPDRHTDAPLHVGHAGPPALAATVAEVVASLPVSFTAAAAAHTGSHAGSHADSLDGSLDLLAVTGTAGWTRRATEALSRARAVVVVDPTAADPDDVDALAAAAQAAGVLVRLSETYAGNPALTQLRTTRPDALAGAGGVFVDSVCPEGSDADLLLGQLRVLRALGLPVTGPRSATAHAGGLTATATARATTAHGAGGSLVVGVAARSHAAAAHVRVNAVAADQTLDVVLPAAASARPATIEVAERGGSWVQPSIPETAHRATWRRVHADLTHAGSTAGDLGDLTDDLRGFAADLRTVLQFGLKIDEEARGFTPLFDGHSLAGWHPAPRVYGTLYPGGPHLRDWMREHGVNPPVDPELHPAVWSVQTDDDGESFVVGEQGTAGYGGYLVSDDTFGDFELRIEVKPDWPADTGIMLRRLRDSWEGFQVLLDHRPSGGIGGFFGNGIGSFHVLPFAVDAELAPDGTVERLVADDLATSAEPVTQDKIDRLTYAGEVEDFLAVWRVGDWNTMRIRCVGAKPVITTWVNDVKVAEVDMATLDAPNYDADAVHAVLGDRGHLALEVHDNDETFGDARWGKGARCLWRNASIKEL